MQLVLEQWSGLLIWWGGLSDEIVGALIGAAATIVIGATGFKIVAWQIAEQARRALYVDIYKDFVGAIREASDLQHGYISLVESFLWDIEAHIELSSPSHTWAIPALRLKKLLDAREEKVNSIIRVLHVIDRWRVINSKIGLFSVALQVGLEQSSKAFRKYYGQFLQIVPKDNGEQWTPPPPAELSLFKTSTSELIKAEWENLYFMMDCETELQFFLLGGLFKTKVNRRTSSEKGELVLSLDNHAKLYSVLNERLKTLR